jgi:hypothetical protein
VPGGGQSGVTCEEYAWGPIPAASSASSWSPPRLGGQVIACDSLCGPGSRPHYLRQLDIGMGE